MLQKIFAILICTFITACGFKPLYYEDNKNYETLSQIKIGNITTGDNPGKVHLSFRKALENTLYFGGEAGAKKYMLNIKVHKSNTGFGTQKNSVNTRNIINITVNFSLEDIATAKEVMHDTLYAYDSFEITKSPYSTLVSEEEGVVHMAKEVANEMKIRIVAYLNTNKMDEVNE